MMRWRAASGGIVSLWRRLSRAPFAARLSSLLAMLAAAVVLAHPVDALAHAGDATGFASATIRSEEHTSELQSQR